MHHEGMSGDNPFILIARIQVKPGMIEDYLDIANDVDLITKQEEPGMLMHNFDQDPTDPLKFTWSEVYENSEALLVHFGASYAGEYVAKSNELADSFEIEIYGDLSNEAIETVKSFGLPFKHFTTSRVGFARNNILSNKRSENISKANQFLNTAFENPDIARSLLHKDFSFQFMGICTICTKEDTDSFFNEFLPEVGRLIPDGIALEVTDTIGDSDNVVLRVAGTAQGINGSYNNNYAMVYTFKDGKIIALNEYNSDLLAETRLFNRQVIPTN
jgi:quinol monooxygenase YgiN/ketosteroid isomerase-like protein